ncbi:MAG TPA: 30S ribosomal protein S8e [Candidatus Korarchaeota archaeon]|nr:30S ribosomal protein S8e [Candidatus Korarchaeota archaeon]
MPVNYHGKVPLRGRTPTGAKLKRFRKKRKYEMGGPPANTHLGHRKVKIVRTKGGGRKIKLLADAYVNVNLGKETKRVRLLGVVENPANRFLTRDNIITKGCIVKTELGLARITSRPGQDGVLNAVIIEESKAD